AASAPALGGFGADAVSRPVAPPHARSSRSAPAAAWPAPSPSAARRGRRRLDGRVATRDPSGRVRYAGLAVRSSDASRTAIAGADPSTPRYRARQDVGTGRAWRPADALRAPPTRVQRPAPRRAREPHDPLCRDRRRRRRRDAPCVRPQAARRLSRLWLALSRLRRPRLHHVPRAPARRLQLQIPWLLPFVPRSSNGPNGMQPARPRSPARPAAPVGADAPSRAAPPPRV